MVCKRLLSIVFFCLMLSGSLFSQEKTGLSFQDRMSVKTNAFEWLVTIPNLGVECDLFRNEFKKISLSITGKYNWNTYHTLPPATVFDMSDLRPEFRYYFRTMNTKISRPWWAMYMGPYFSYGTYTFKLSEKGIRGYSAGVGVSAGYVIPMYEYRRGAVDVELGLSVGLQMCEKDVFIHNPERYTYIRSDEECRPLHVTPFPVLSEMRVAFAWRRESIRHQVKIDFQKQQQRQTYRKYMSLMLEDIDVNLPLSLALEFKDIEMLDKELDGRCLYLTGDNAIGSEFYGFTQSDVKKLTRKVERRCREVRRTFLEMKKN